MGAHRAAQLPNCAGRGRIQGKFRRISGKLRSPCADRSFSCVNRRRRGGKLCRLQCTLYASGNEFLRRGALSEQDVIFLDICMPGLDGIETARRLRGEDPRIPIVFVTSSEEYVWDALPLHPFDYLRKPYDDARVRKLLDDLLAALGRPEPELRVARQLIQVPFRRIHYALAQNHFVSVCTDEGEHRATATFAQIQEQLCGDPRFLLCNRGVVVNMDKVLRFEGDAIQMLQGPAFPVRQKDKGRLFAAFTQYQFRHMRREL